MCIMSLYNCGSFTFAHSLARRLAAAAAAAIKFYFSFSFFCFDFFLHFCCKVVAVVASVSKASRIVLANRKFNKLCTPFTICIKLWLCAFRIYRFPLLSFSLWLLGCMSVSLCVWTITSRWCALSCRHANSYSRQYNRAHTLLPLWFISNQ